MRIVAITRALNEADIIECFVRHTAAFVAHHVIMDDGSSDATLDILAALKREGLALTVHQSRSISYNESDTLTQLYLAACRAHDPDWVWCLDADEFIDDRRLTGGLLPYLQRLLELPQSLDYLSIPMVNYVATSQDDAAEPITPVRMRRRQAPSDAYKVVVRGNLADQGVRIAHGSHWVSLERRGAIHARDLPLSLAHYSERSAYQYIVKFVRGWSKVLATGQAEVERRTAYHYQGPYEILRDRPQDLLRNAHFMGFKNESVDLVDDPIDYRGGALAYTPTSDEAMRAVQCLMGFLDELARRHGRLLDQIPAARQAVREWEQLSHKIL